MPDNEEELNLEHRLGQIENNAEGDHKAIREVSRDLQKLQAEFAEFRKKSREDVNFLMWTLDTVRNWALQAIAGNHERSIPLDQKVVEQLQELKKRLAL